MTVWCHGRCGITIFQLVYPFQPRVDHLNEKQIYIKIGPLNAWFVLTGNQDESLLDNDRSRLNRLLRHRRRNSHGYVHDQVAYDTDVLMFLVSTADGELPRLVA